MISLLSALWLGILTSISPCPLATNIAAVSYLSKKISHPKSVFLACTVYTLGRMAAYTALGAVIISSLTSIPSVANFLQKYMNKILGPILIIIGLFLLDVIRFNIFGFSVSAEKQNILAETGVKGAFILGVLFALSFCPISAALFFGSLVPLAINNRFGLVYPILYGIGTGLPVIIFSIGIALGVATITHWFNKMSIFEKYSRKITGIIFVLVGIYFIWNHIMITLI